MSVGPGIRPQKCQRDNFTRELPCLQQSILSVPVCMKPSLTSVSRTPDMHGSYVAFTPVESNEMSFPCKNQHLFLVWYVSESRNMHALTECLDKREKRSTSRHRRWSVVPNESSRDFGPCDRFWTQLALRCFQYLYFKQS